MKLRIDIVFCLLLGTKPSRSNDCLHRHMCLIRHHADQNCVPVQQKLTLRVGDIYFKNLTWFYVGVRCKWNEVIWRQA